jgi:FtsP/CotA-like multicopper oxidase with cupredoxin domain
MRRRVLALGLLVVLGLCGACASGDSNGSSSTPASSSSSAAASSEGPTESAQPEEISVAVKNGTVLPPTHRVEISKGDRVELNVTSDVDDEVHVHGYDIEKPVSAGETVTIEFTADQAGLFEVETHESALQVLQLEVR